MHKVTVHFIDGTEKLMSRVDAHRACQQHPDQCAFLPFDEKEVAKHLAKAEREGIAPKGASEEQQIEALKARIGDLTAELARQTERADAAEARVAELESMPAGNGVAGSAEPEITIVEHEGDPLDAIEMPDDWSKLTFPKQKALADQIASHTGEPASNKDEVESVLRNEAARRAGGADSKGGD